MNFERSEYNQITREYLTTLGLNRVIEMCLALREDAVAFADFVNLNPSNSSRPPSSRTPWDRSITPDDQTDLNEKNEEKKPSDDAESDKRSTSSDNDKPIPPTPPKVKPKRKPGKQKGAKGFGRTQQLIITHTQIHRPECCKGCGKILDSTVIFNPKGGHISIDLKFPEIGTVDMQGSVTKHIYGSSLCYCGFETTTKPHRVEKEAGWTVEMGEWKLIGPTLQAFLVFLKLRMHMTLSKSRDLLKIWLGISLSDGCINQALREAGRASSSLEPEIVAALKAAGILFVDETSWKEQKVTRWAWVAVGEYVVYYAIGSRTKEMAEKILSGFGGTLMTDGYKAYRFFENRLRCWAHLIRKSKALEESCDKAAATFGKMAHGSLKNLQDHIYKMRELPLEECLPEKEKASKEKDVFLKACMMELITPTHDQSRAFAGEIVNDYEVIFKQVDNPEFALTNNRAEQEFRWMVLMRKMSHGSKTSEGSNSIASLASVMGTLLVRGLDPWQFFPNLFCLRRSGMPPPILPIPLLNLNSSIKPLAL